ncbi:MAG: formylglycine-generating enzyme family protein [Deltaproteobacteria bacterium]|nr:formylglycine-generating enzyme family protein [Deltaproteobacteria bacterium]
MVKIPSGTFQMGGEGSDNEQPIHEVKVPEFWMLSTPVTQAQWQAVMGTDPSTFKGPERPVENVSWNDAKKFCDKLSAHTRETYRLSSEAEWEYACRAGSNDRYCFGNDENILGDYAWYDKNSKGETHPVAQKEPNNFNLYDMHGNVWEWCEDTWHDNYKDAPRDGSAWVSEDEPGRVVRGASWDSSNPRDLRSSSRVRYGADSGSLFIGFRCVRSSH